LARQELERANRELEEFAYVASHDLQEPLRMVAIYTQLLLTRYLPDNDTAEQYAGFVRQGVDRMQRLIQDLLTYSRIIHADPSPVSVADLNESLNMALSTMQTSIEETKAKVIASPLPEVGGETSQFVNVFENLIGNSLKYRNKDLLPEIRITASRQAENWIISVADNGIGFEPQYAERIFGLFKRLHKDEFPGTGLGLAICQRIVERHGGRIWAEGKPKQGSIFFMALPAVDAK
jgi:light-regulated signal transduction histidine kinase (bacteriophytochrome)